MEFLAPILATVVSAAVADTGVVPATAPIAAEKIALGNSREGRRLDLSDWVLGCRV